MKAVVLHEYGGPEKLQYEENVPAPEVGDETVLIAAAAASVNPIDWKVRSGARQKDFPQTFPAILGRDVSGVVRAVGPKVKNFKPGERVLAFTSRTYAELVAVPESQVTHLPDGAALADAAAIPLVILTGDQLVRNAAKVQSGWKVLVTGAVGSVGRAAVHSAKKLGAKVYAGVRASQLEEAKKLGAAGVLALDDDAAIAQFPELDAVADTVGGAVAAKVITRIRPGGFFGYASVIPEGTAEKFPQVKITRVFAQPDPSKVREFADDIRDGKFVLPIARRLPLSAASEAHTLVEKGGTAGKVLLLIAEDPK